MPDSYGRLNDDGIGKIEGPAVECHLFRAEMGVDWPETEFERAAEHACTTEHALSVWHWDRITRQSVKVVPGSTLTLSLLSALLSRQN